MTTIFSGLPTSRGVTRDFRNNHINNVTTNRIPFYTTAVQPAPAPANKGQIIYDTTKNEFCYCNGTIWVCLSAASAATVGIVDCTVGSAANPNAQYNSVQAALDGGCRNIRLLDGLIGGQVPGYFEPGPIAFSAVGSPVMIYITPGVDWVLRQSDVGTGGIDMTSSVVIFRGSGFASVMRQFQDGGAPASVFALDNSSLIQWTDLTFTTTADAVAFPVPMGRLIWRGCQYVLTSASLAAWSFTTTGNSSGNQIEFHEITFIAFDTTSRMIDNSDAGNNGALTLTNCTHQGSSLDPAVDVTYRFGTVGGQVTVDGFELFGEAPMSISFGGALSSYNSIYQNGTGAVTAIMTGTLHLNNGRFDTITFPFGPNHLSNVEITGATAIDITSGVNQLDEVFFAAADLTISSTFNVLDGGSSLSLTITSTNNRVSNFRPGLFLTLGVGAVDNVLQGLDVFGPVVIADDNNTVSNLNSTVGTLAVAGDFNIITANKYGGTATISGARNRLLNCGITAGDIIVSGINNQISNCDMTNLSLSGVGNEENKVNNCNVTTSLLIDGTKNNVAGCDVGSTTVLGATAAATGNTIRGCNLTGPVTIGGFSAATNNSLSGNKIGGSVSIGGAVSTVGNVLDGNTIEASGGTPTLTVGLLGGAISQDCIITSNFVEGILTVNNSVGIMETDNCVFSGNRFLGGIAALVDSTTGVQPLFTGNIIAGGGATATVTNGHANGITNSAP